MEQFNTGMDILERGKKAVEGFYPLPYADVDKTLREATKKTGDAIKKELIERLDEIKEIESAYV